MKRSTEVPKGKSSASSARGSAGANDRKLGRAMATDPEALPPLRKTERDGVYLNRDDAKVDGHGVLLSLRRLKTIEAEDQSEVEAEPTVSSPAAYLRLVALDPRQSIGTRMQAAIAAAPYFDRKMPLALEGGDPTRPIKSESSVAIRQLENLALPERKAAIALLEKLGLIPKTD